MGHKYGGNDTPEFLAMNPNGTVPVLKDGVGQPLWETGAVLRYLSNRYGAESFWPPDVQRRAQIDKWAEWSKINVALRRYYDALTARPAFREHVIVSYDELRVA